MDAQKGMAATTSVIMTAVVGVALVFVATGGNPMSAFNSDSPDNVNNGDSNTPVEFQPVEWNNGYHVPMEVRAPVTSDLAADIFTGSPKSDGEYGNFVEYNQSEATGGMTQGVDFFSQSVTGEQTITFPESTSIQSGTYQIAVVDTASSKEYHPLFTEVEIPETITFSAYNNDKPEVLVEQGEFMRRADYNSDSAEITMINGEAAQFSDLDGDTNLSSSAWSSSNDDETVTVERTVDYKHGVDLLGEVSISNVASSVNEADLEITAQTPNGEKVVYDKTVAENGAKVSGLETTIPDLSDTEDMETNPDVVNGLTAILDVEFDGTQSSADSTAITFDVQDIYGSSVGTAGSTSLVY